MNAFTQRDAQRAPANDWITCPDCDGAGSHTHNDTNPHGYGPDPQCDYEVECATCGGDGELEDGHIDPLRKMRRYRIRSRYSWSRDAAMNRTCYSMVRRDAMQPVVLP